MSVVKLLEAEVEQPIGRPMLKIEQYMNERGLTVHSLRKAARLSAGFYRAYRGESKPAKPTVQKLADYFKIPEDEVRVLFTPLKKVTKREREREREDQIDLRIAKERLDEIARNPASLVRILPQEVASEPDGKMSVQLSTLPDGQAHLVLHLDRVVPLAEALTLLRCLGGG